MKKNIINFTILLIITGLVLYFSLKDNYETIIKEIFNMNPFYLLLALICFLVYLILKGVILGNITRKFQPNYKNKSSIRMTFETTFFHAITPFATGGQPYEIYRLNKDGVNSMSAANVSIQAFIVYQIVLVLLGIGAMVYNFYFKLFPQTGVIKDLVILGFSINILVIVFLFIITYTKRLKKIILEFIVTILCKTRIIKNGAAVNEKLTTYLSDFDKGAKLLLEDKKQFVKLLLIQFISLAAFYATPYFVILAANNYSVNLIESIVTTAYIMIIGSFVPIPGGTGGIEYGFVQFFGNFITGGALNAMMLVWRFITYYLGMILGMICLVLRKKA